MAMNFDKPYCPCGKQMVPAVLQVFNEATTVVVCPTCNYTLAVPTEYPSTYYIDFVEVLNQ